MNFHTQTRTQAVALTTNAFLDIKDWIAEHGNYDDGEGQSMNAFDRPIEMTIKDMHTGTDTACVRAEIALNIGSLPVYTQHFDKIVALRRFLNERDTPFQEIALECGDVASDHFVTLRSSVAYDG